MTMNDCPESSLLFVQTCTVLVSFDSSYSSLHFFSQVLHIPTSLLEVSNVYETYMFYRTSYEPIILINWVLIISYILLYHSVYKSWVLLGGRLSSFALYFEIGSSLGPSLIGNQIWVVWSHLMSTFMLFSRVWILFLFFLFQFTFFNPLFYIVFISELILVMSLHESVSQYCIPYFSFIFPQIIRFLNLLVM